MLVARTGVLPEIAAACAAAFVATIFKPLLLSESPEEEEEVRNAQLLLSPVKNAEERGRDIAHMVEEGEQEADDEDAVSAFLSERACCIVTAPPACTAMAAIFSHPFSDRGQTTNAAAYRLPSIRKLQ